MAKTKLTAGELRQCAMALDNRIDYLKAQGILNAGAQPETSAWFASLAADARTLQSKVLRVARRKDGYG